MTTKTIEHKIKTTIKNHPNEIKYPCRSCQEIIHASYSLLSTLDQEQCKLLFTNDLILNEEETAKLYDEIKVEDIIGVGILRKRGWTANQYKIKEVTDKDFLICENRFNNQIEEISFQDVSVGLALGFAEILYRDEKPFGISTEKEYNVKIKVNEEDLKEGKEGEKK